MATKKIVVPVEDREEEYKLYHLLVLMATTRESAMNMTSSKFADSKLRNHFAKCVQSMNYVCDHFIKNIEPGAEDAFADAVESVYESLMTQIKKQNKPTKVKVK